MTPLALLLAVTVAASEARPPSARVDTTYPPRTGRTLNVAAGGDLQSALEAARPGDDIVLEAGAVYTGPFTLPPKSGHAWIVIRSSGRSPSSLIADGPLRGRVFPSSLALPAPGVRVGPAQSPLMPKLEARWGAVISAEPLSHHYRFVGIEVRPTRGAFLKNLVLLGSRESTLAALPHHFIFDRCYIHGDPVKGARRGIALNSRETAVVDSWLSDFKETGADSQAIAGWNGEGPFRIENNHLEGAGENVLFGGADPKIEGLVPSDIEIVRNHFRKPLAWMEGHSTYEGLSLIHI